MQQPGREWSSEEYRFAFNGMEKDDEMKGEGNSYDFGARIYDPRIGRWLSRDAYESFYPHYSPYNFALNTPVQAIDPDGNLVLFINGLRTDPIEVLGGVPNPFIYDHRSWGKWNGIYRAGDAGPLREYWRTPKGKTNTFGREVDMVQKFIDRIGDDNVLYTSGSSRWQSQVRYRLKHLLKPWKYFIRTRKGDGKRKAKKFHKMVQKAKKEGKPILEKGESIKIVSHSQGGAHTRGFVEQLETYKDEEGNPLYNIEVVYDITPHQSSDFTRFQEGIRNVVYQHPSDAVSGDNDPWWLPNGGSEIGEVEGAENIIKDIMGGEGQPPCGGPEGNRCGHNVWDNDEFIFNIPSGEPGAVEYRKDKPQK